MLRKAVGYMDHLVKEAIEIWLNTKNFNGDAIQSESWARQSEQLTLPTSPHWLACSRERWVGAGIHIVMYSGSIHDGSLLQLQKSIHYS
jgi:hypothetical protein